MNRPFLPPISVYGSGRGNKRMMFDGNKPSILDLIPTFIIFEILSHVPFKTLSVCRCVCKVFRSLISDPYLFNLRLENGKHPVSVLLQSHRGQLTLFELGNKYTFGSLSDRIIRFKPGFNVPPGGRYLRFVDSCNGFICFYSNHVNNHPIYVCNPILGEYIEIPQKFKEELSTLSYGFGYSSITDEYKVMKVFETNGTVKGKYDLRFKIFTLGQAGWRYVRNDPYQQLQQTRGFRRNLQYLNGALHWKLHNCIYVFDLAEERIKKCFTLPFSEDRTNYLQFYVIGSYLCVEDHSKFPITDYWFMKEYGVTESWTKIRVNGKPAFSLPVTLWKCREIFFTSFATGSNTGYVSYDPVAETFKQVDFYDTRQGERAYNFVPSFLTLKDVLKKGRPRILENYKMFCSTHEFKEKHDSTEADEIQYMIIFGIIFNISFDLCV